MQTERTFRDPDEPPASEETSGIAPLARDYRQEVEDCDAQLAQSLNQLAQMFHAADVVNMGAQ
jgi:hypothetical protein